MTAFDSNVEAGSGNMFADLGRRPSRTDRGNRANRVHCVAFRCEFPLPGLSVSRTEKRARLYRRIDPLRWGGGGRRRGYPLRRFTAHEGLGGRDAGRSCAIMRRGAHRHPQHQGLRTLPNPGHHAPTSLEPPSRCLTDALFSQPLARAAKARLLSLLVRPGTWREASWHRGKWAFRQFASGKNRPAQISRNQIRSRFHSHHACQPGCRDETKRLCPYIFPPIRP